MYFSDRWRPRARHMPRNYSNLHGLAPIPDTLIQAHLAHYERCVQEANHSPDAGMPPLESAAERDLRLHELYFENLSPRPTRMSKRFEFDLSITWGSSRAWKEEFMAMGRMDKVAWVLLLMDPVEYQLSNHWIGVDGEGHPSGFFPVLVLDVQEHAFQGMERSQYLEACLENIDWKCVENRHSISSTLPRRGELLQPSPPLRSQAVSSA